jgi:hypothetical protein
MYHHCLFFYHTHKEIYNSCYSGESQYKRLIKDTKKELLYTTRHMHEYDLSEYTKDFFCLKCVKYLYPDYKPRDVIVVGKAYVQNTCGIKSFDKYLKMVVK